MLSPGDGSYRESVADRLDQVPGMDFARNYWRREFPELLATAAAARGAQPAAQQARAG